MNKKNNIEKIIIGFVIFIVSVFAIYFLLGKSVLPSKYDNFAKCLQQKNIKMYGAFWCPHCNDQKEMFDGALEKNNIYIECAKGKTGQTDECKNAKIEAYPTWDFGYGKEEGVFSLEDISKKTTCPIQ